MEGREIEELVVKLAREGHPPSRIGLILRDLHGIGSVKKATGKSITQILEERGIKFPLPEDLANLIRRALRMQKHLEKNRKDKVTRRSLEITEQRIRKLSRYYVRVGKLPKDWKYEREKAALLVR
ncbi:MAG: 30S ribosomal protein S15 [Hadesarchaea archaeon]|nr:MAG: 30S ribosomal protein S15 [Hadesarchaea archaeon]TDA33564.1 MAG: 30S ribosomal protein S15 [Hadesarchaea archaeon]